ncbi:uncharacterized protein Z518_05616 [Rhinocladiella mackenziei CBS 650.93]|uniref:Amidohydrolase-related domain-containing protein n=1 Tax=Rhinocladiella mackenziei CBS 650.93 TaxID=1442369 RepID=A0A0D2INN4_9EURO|nr:uncharacterized protein Z518_05616 [Rhinocladiella mackenziei CBS 650.93]KIX04746.1 hypothetical protein Z518_05616 [Rhinocladiella mackenziei CBS 650.93]
MGHIGYPWAAETVAVAWKHKNVYIDRVNEYLVKDESTLEEFMGGNALRLLRLPPVSLVKIKPKM